MLLDEVIRDQYKYIICCSRCGERFFSIVEILDIVPTICGNCNIHMPVKFLNNSRCYEEIAIVKNLTNQENVV